MVVASVSCIYGIGSKEDYEEMVIPMRVGQHISREQFLSRLVDLQYDRNDIAFERGHFRVRGDTVEVRPAGREDGLRVEFFGEEIERHHALRAVDRKQNRIARRRHRFSRQNNSSRPVTR